MSVNGTTYAIRNHNAAINDVTIVTYVIANALILSQMNATNVKIKLLTSVMGVRRKQRADRINTITQL